MALGGTESVKILNTQKMNLKEMEVTDFQGTIVHSVLLLHFNLMMINNSLLTAFLILILIFKTI